MNVNTTPAMRPADAAGGGLNPAINYGDARADESARARGATATRNRYTEARDSQHVLKAEAARPDATDRETIAIASPVGGPMGCWVSRRRGARHDQCPPGYRNTVAAIPSRRTGGPAGAIRPRHALATGRSGVASTSPRAARVFAPGPRVRGFLSDLHVSSLLVMLCSEASATPPLRASTTRAGSFACPHSAHVPPRTWDFAR